MVGLRVRSWFASLCLCLATMMAAIASMRSDVNAGIVPSHGAGAATSRDPDLERIQRMLEHKVVRQKLLDYGMSPREAISKVRQLGDKELHLLATRTERIPEGGSLAGVNAEGALLISLVLAAIAVVIYIISLGVKAVVSDMLYKPSPEDASSQPAPLPEPGR